MADSGASSDIDLLIASDYYWDLVTGKVKTGKPSEPVAFETVFGWILNGPVASKSVDSSTNLPVSNYMFKVNNRNTRTSCEICSKLTVKTPERRY